MITTIEIYNANVANLKTNDQFVEGMSIDRPTKDELKTIIWRFRNNIDRMKETKDGIITLDEDKVYAEITTLTISIFALIDNNNYNESQLSSLAEILIELISFANILDYDGNSEELSILKDQIATLKIEGSTDKLILSRYKSFVRNITKQKIIKSDHVKNIVIAAIVSLLGVQLLVK